MKQFLHVGCGAADQSRTTPEFRQDSWREVRLDINPDARPDVVGSMTDMAEVTSGSMHAVYSSHNIEHLFPHEVPLALAEFRRVLTDDGYAVITCPDLQSVCALIAQDRLTEPAYTSPAGPIAPLDIVYGHRAQIAAGNAYMAHRCGFTKKVLMATLQAAGFAGVIAVAVPQQFALWALASKASLTEAELRALAGRHFPVAVG